MKPLAHVLMLVTALSGASRTVHAADAPTLPRPELPASIRPSPTWIAQAAEDAKHDVSSIPFDGITPNKLACDTTLRELPDGSWVMVLPDRCTLFFAALDQLRRHEDWPYQRVLVEHSRDGPGRSLNDPDGFVDRDRQWLHFAYDDNRHRAVHYSAKLPPLPAPNAAAAPRPAAPAVP